MKLPSAHQVIRFVAPVTGAVGLAQFAQATEPVREPADGQMLVRNVLLSLDPSQRRQMMPGVEYAEPLRLGDVMIGRTMARVVSSRLPGYSPGDWVRGKFGWQEYAVSNGMHVERIELDGFAPSRYLGALGNPGITAWVGLEVVAQARAGETVVISAACGAVGGAAAAIARARGCHPVGIAGDARKCRHAVEQLGYEACVDYRAPDFVAALSAATPLGVDVDFENVGGAVFDAVLGRLNDHARIALCGLVSQYNLAEPDGLRNVAALLNHNVRLQGFRLAQYARHRAQALGELKALLRSGAYRPDETIVEGLDQAPQAFMDLFRGVNMGKMLVRIAPEE